MSHNVRKGTFWHERTAKIQISLRIRAIWSESSLGAFWLAKDVKILQVDNEDYDQIALIHRLFWVFLGRTHLKVRFLTLRLKMSVMNCNTANLTVSNVLTSKAQIGMHLLAILSESLRFAPWILIVCTLVLWSEKNSKRSVLMHILIWSHY